MEAKTLLGGVTTTQGIALFSNNGARRYYRGLVRNVESTADPDLPDALTRIADVDASDAASFLARLKKASCLLLHLSEGTNPAAHKHFEALHLAGDNWAVARALAGIHCVALQAPDFDVLAARDASMIWSPLSNLLLYGQTANVKAAAAAGVTIGIGPDWAPSGSKNLLGELKVAYLEARRQGLDWSARDIVSLATSNAAKILRWDTALGSLEAGKKADVLVIESTSGDAYEALLRSSETSIVLVVINGIPRLGTGALMKSLGIVKGESIREGHHIRVINVAQETADPDVAKLRVSQAADLLRTALKNLPMLAARVKRAALPGVSVRGASLLERPTRWCLALDEIEPSGYEQRPRLRLGGKMTGADTHPRAAVAPSKLPSLTLDPLTVAGDATFLDRVAAERVLPAEIASGLRDLY